MQLSIEILGNGVEKSLKEVVGHALRSKGYTSYTEFAERVSKETGSEVHAEVAGVSRVMQGKTTRLMPERAKAYAKVLGVSEKTLLAFCAAGKYHKKSKPIIIDDNTLITRAIKRLAVNDTVTLEDLVKELLYLGHQVA